MTSGNRPQLGISSIGALFVLTIVCLMAAVTVRIYGVHLGGHAAAVASIRAYHAAASGLEWGLYRVENDGACPAVADSDFTFVEAGLNNIKVSIRCRLTLHNEGTTTIEVFYITAESEFGQFGDAGYVNRRLEVTMALD